MQQPPIQINPAELIQKIGALTIELEALRGFISSHECPKCELKHCDDCECADGACSSKDSD